MARTKSAETDPATGRPLPSGVTYRGPLQYRARKMVDGSRITSTFESARLAREWLEETSASVRRGAFVDRRPLEQCTLKELIERFVRERMQDGGERRGAAEDRGHIPAIVDDLIGSLTLAKLTPIAVRGFRDRQMEDYAASTVVKRLNLLSGVLAYAMAEWDVPLGVNPATAKLVKRPAGADQKRDRRLLPPKPSEVRAAIARGEEAPKHEEELLLAAVAKSDVPGDVFLVRLAIAQAMRQGELLALRWRDLDFDAKVVKVHGRHERGVKSAKHKKVRGPEERPLMPEAIAILQEILGDSKPDSAEHIFNVGNPNAFRVRFGRMMTRAKLLDLTFHDLRHESTSRLAKRYPNPLDLKRVTGHVDLKSLDRYYQPDLTELAERTA